MKTIFVIGCGFITMVSTMVMSQSINKLTKEEKKFKKDSVREVKVSEGKSLISPLLVPGYTPELGGLIAVGGLWSFKTNKNDTFIQRSSVPFTFSLTTTGAVVAQVRPTTFWFKDKLRITGEFWYKDMPDNYWGVGYEDGYTTPISDSTTAYNREWWWVNPQFLYQVKPNYFVGLNVDYNYTKGSNPSTGVKEDDNYQQYNDRPLNSGLGIVLRHDSRDVPVNAWEGKYIDISTTFYSTSFGGDNDYQTLLLDYRQYERVGKVGQTFCWQVKARLGFGDIPYSEMGQLGNPFDLRGYMWGRYRDKNLFYVIPEYRHTFYKQSGEISKHGAIVWVGTGSIWDFDKTNGQNLNWLPNFGVGYRLELQPRMNLRLDVGIGKETSGIYFNFNEAF